MPKPLEAPLMGDGDTGVEETWRGRHPRPLKSLELPGAIKPSSRLSLPQPLPAVHSDLHFPGEKNEAQRGWGTHYKASLHDDIQTQSSGHWVHPLHGGISPRNQEAVSSFSIIIIILRLAPGETRSFISTFLQLSIPAPRNSYHFWAHWRGCSPLGPSR